MYGDSDGSGNVSGDFTDQRLGNADFYRNISCVSRKKTSFLIFSSLPSLSIFINLFVLLAVLLDSRRLLRQSRVYAHVSSTLVANVAFSMFALVQILSLYFNFEGHDDDPRTGYQGAVRKELVEWWAFRKAFLYGLYIIMCGNIGLLIEAIRSSTCIALRSAAGAVHIRSNEISRWQRPFSFMSSRRASKKSHDTAVPSSRVIRRRQSYVFISLLWIVSLLYAAIPSIGWSCAHSCTCLSSCFPAELLSHPPVRGCSRAFPPMANSWLALTIAIWAVCLLGVIILLRRSILVLRRMKEKHHPAMNDVVLTTLVTASCAVSVGNLPKCNSSAINRECVGSVNSDNLQYESRNDEVFEVDDVAHPHIDKNDNHPTTGVVDGMDCQNYITHNKKMSTKSHVKTSITADSKTKKKTNRSERGSSISWSNIFSSEGRALLRRKSRPVTKGLVHLLEMTSSLKYVIWLTVLFGICTAPAMIYLSTDMIFTGLKLNMVVLNVCLLFPFAYCFICPILLVKCLPGVKSSLVHLCLRMCTHTTIERGYSR